MSCFVINGNRIDRIYTTKGPFSKIRATLSKWLLQQNNLIELTKLIKNTNKYHLVSIKRLIFMRFDNRNNIDFLVNCLTCIDDILVKERNDFKKRRTRKFDNFIKITHANKIMDYCNNIRDILRSRESKELLGIESIPQICDKQLPAIGNWICNFTKVAKTIPTELINIPQGIECIC